MRYLFVHQNFPGQFRHVARMLADDPANQVVGVGDARTLSGRPPLHPRIGVIAYKSPAPGGRETHHYLRDYEVHIRRGQAVARALMHWREHGGFAPDVVVAHPGWGEALFLKDLFPDARHVNYFEYFYRSAGGDVAFDPEFPSSLDDLLRLRVRNSTQLQALVACDQGISPTAWQRSTYPLEFKSKIAVIHDGIDTAAVKPDPKSCLELGDLRFAAGDEIVTYVARNLEPYRGFHTLMRALPRLQSLRPDARVLIVGGDEVSYGRRLPDGKTYRTLYCDEVQHQVDSGRVFFVGKLPYADYLKVLQISAAHVYFTYPFVLSWSMLEAMSAGCLLIASSTAPVAEVVESGRNGILLDFFDANALAHTLAGVLAAPAQYRHMREVARETIVERFDLQRVCLPRQRLLLNGA